MMSSMEQQPTISQGWRKKSTVTVLYSYSYPAGSKGGEPISMKEGERLILLEKSNADWWQVRRPGDKSQPFYAPANYLQEDGLSRAHKKGPAPSARHHLGESRSDDSLLQSPSKSGHHHHHNKRWSASAVNKELRKQRSTSMDAIMFLELLEQEIHEDTPVKKTSEPLSEKFKKPRISKDLWERRKSWAVEELNPGRPSSHSVQRFPPLKETSAPPLPPRSDSNNKAAVVVVSTTDKLSSTDKAPALPPKRSQQSSADNYSRVTPHLRSSPSKDIPQKKQLSESLEKLAQQINTTPLSYPHPIPPPRRSGGGGGGSPSDPMGNNQSTTSSPPPQLPPKATASSGIVKGSTKQSSNPPPTKSKKEEVKDNYVNLLGRPVTVVSDSVEDIQSDESGINMSFNNPLFNEKEEKDDSQEQVDLESSIEDGASLKAVKSRRSQSNLSGSEELDGTYPSSGEDILSSKDSLNSIPSTKNEHYSRLKQPPESPTPKQRPQRELFEGWAEFMDAVTGRPFYFNRETRAKSWKPPRRRGASPMIRGVSIEEEEVDGDTGTPERLSSSAESDHHLRDDSRSQLRTRSQVAAIEAVVEAARNRALPPVPPGWIESIDPYTEEVVYTNTLTGAKWYTSLDKEGRIYFYEEDSHESLWALPNISPAVKPMEAEAQGIQQGVFYPEGSKLNPKMNPNGQQTPSIPTISLSKWDQVRQRTGGPSVKSERGSKTRSMVLTNFSGCVEDVPIENREGAGQTVLHPVLPASVTQSVSKTASLPRHSSMSPQWPTLQGGSIRVLRQGILQKTKLTENGKKIRKNWTSSWVVLADLFLFIFKESSSTKMAAASGNKEPGSGSSAALSATTNKPELCVDLNGATIEWAAVKSSRKGVFQVSTLLGVQLLLQDEDETNAVVWFNEIKKAILRLPCASKETNNSYPTPIVTPIMSSKNKNRNQPDKSSSTSPESRSAFQESNSNFLTPPSPTDGLSFSSGGSFLSKQGSRKGKLGRTKSTKVPHILGSSEDLTASSTSTGAANPVERQIKLRDKLRKFFVRRPTVETLVKKGIWKDEPVFGCRLTALCAADETTVPKFVQQVIQLIESKPENMKADGIYRASGNLSQIQKIRLQVDQYNWAILEIEDDVHVLTGCLKLFFRELKEPLIPCELFERALQVTSVGSSSERTRKYKEIIECLPIENYDTLQYLFRHLLEITKYREFNRMHISNLAIVFGPTLMWAATASNNLALDMMQQNLVVEALLNNYQHIFKSPANTSISARR